MATLPDVAGSSRTSAPRPNLGVAGYEPAQVGGIAAQSMRQAGAEFQQAADMVAATNARQDAIVAQSKINALDQDAMMMEFDTAKGFRSSRESAAVGPKFLEAYQAQFEAARKRARESLSPSQQRIFDQHAEVRATRFKGALLAHQAQETERFNDTTSNAQITNGLQRIAVDPSNELTFQSGLDDIKRTIMETGARKGWGKDQVDSVSAKFYDAAYTTRITSILHGIPGVQDANPYQAEAMFRQVQAGLSPQAQTHLAREVERGIMDVQARDFAEAITRGRAPVKPQEIAPAVTGVPLEGVVLHLESRGQRYGKDGELLTSSAGAKGEMQVMPQTMMNPGYGIRPVQLDKDGKPIPDDIARVGRDLLGALTARLEHPALVLAAYNAGEGRVQQWLKEYGDPRTGGVNTVDWAMKIPFKETREYVINGLRKLANEGGELSMPVTAPTANQLKIDLTDRVEYARQWAEQVRPGNVAFADAVAARVAAKGNQIINAQQGREAAARDGLIQGMIGQRPDGSDAPQTIDELLRDPTMRRNWETATPEVKQGIQRHFMAERDQKWTPEGWRTYYALISEANTNRDAFIRRDFAGLFGAMPVSGVHEIARLQASLRTRESREADQVASYSKANDQAESALRVLKIGGSPMGKKAKAGTEAAEWTEAFYGQLHTQMDAFHKKNGRRPEQDDIAKMISGLLTSIDVPGRIFSGWTDKMPAYRAASEGRMEGATVALPKNEAVRNELRSIFKVKMGRTPSDRELLDFYTRYKLGGGEDPVPGTSVVESQLRPPSAVPQSMWRPGQ